MGASGGNPGPELACPDGASIIGISVHLSDQDTANGGRSAVGLSLACAELRLGGAGPVVGAVTRQEVMGDGRFGWTPATESTTAFCPPGWLMSGLEASRGRSGDRFLNLTLSCAELDASGAVTAGRRRLYVEGSQVETGQIDVVDCPPGQVVRAIETRIGAGFDAAGLLCATPSCAP